MHVCIYIPFPKVHPELLVGRPSATEPVAESAGGCARCSVEELPRWLEMKRVLSSLIVLMVFQWCFDGVLMVF